MADIPYIPVPEQPRTTGQPILADPSAASAPWRAVAQVGQDIQGLGKMAFQHFERKQKLTDNAGIARVNTESLHTVDQINAEILENADNHEIWTDIAKQRWDEYAKALPERFKKAGMSEEAIMSATTRMDGIRQNSLNKVFLKKEARDIELKQMAITMNAEQYYRNELWEYGDAEVDKIPGLADVEREQMKQKLKGNSEYHRVEEILSTAQTPEEFDIFIEEMEAKEGKGKDERFVNYEMLDSSQRRTLVKYAKSRKKAITLQQGKSVVEAWDDLEDGTYGRKTRQKLQLQGVPDETLDQLEKAATMKASVEENSTVVKGLRNRLQQNFFEVWTNGDRDDKEFMEILADINEADLTEKTRNNLTRDWINAWYADVSDGRLELTGRRERDLDDAEIKTYDKLFTAYKIVNDQDIIGSAVLGGMIQDQMRRFDEWYRTHEKVTQEDIDKQYDIYMGELFGEKARVQAQQAVQSILNPTGDMFGGQ